MSDKKLIQIAANAVKAKLVNADRDAKLIVSELLSYEVEGAEHTDAFKKKRWDGRSTFFTFKEATFPAGFVNSVQAALIKRGYHVQLLVKKAPAPRGERHPKVDDFPIDPRYDYQDKSEDVVVKHKRVILQVATGGGKSRIAKKVAARIGRQTLFLTTRSVLMWQMQRAYAEMVKVNDTLGRQIGVMGDGTFKLNKGGINVGMVQTIAAKLAPTTVDAEAEKLVEAEATREQKEVDDLQRALRRSKTPLSEIKTEIDKLRARQVRNRTPENQIIDKAREKAERQMKARAQMIEFLQSVELIIAEEAHEAGSTSYYDIMQACTNAHYRVALTATPFMRPDGEANMRLMGCTGPIGIRISEKLLIDRGILAKPYFKYITCDYLAPKAGRRLHRTTKWQQAYKLGIVENRARNREIIKEALRGSKLGLRAMILVQHKAHGKTLRDALRKLGVRVEFIFGEHDQDRRDWAIDKLKKGELDVLIGSTILDVGVDVPAVDLVILAGGGKAEVALRQRIGRGLRAKKGKANVCFVIDFTDRWNSYLAEHATQRKRIVATTPGFAENIIPEGQDFDLSVLEKEKAA